MALIEEQKKFRRRSQLMSDNLARGTGLLIIEVVNSNPNGDPDRESDPRQLPDDRGMISSVSFKRKLRNLVGDKEGPAWAYLQGRFGLNAEEHFILETRGRVRKDITEEMTSGVFTGKYWDARVFGNTFLEGKNGDESDDEAKLWQYIKCGAVQFGLGVSIAPVEIDRSTVTNMPGVQDGKTRGMAPLAFRIVKHGVYAMPFFVNPFAGRQAGCTAQDIETMLATIPIAYSNTASVARPFVTIRKAWYIEHKTPLGSVSDYMILDALTPRKLNDPDVPSKRWGEYEAPDVLPAEVLARVATVRELMSEYDAVVNGISVGGGGAA